MPGLPGTHKKRRRVRKIHLTYDISSFLAVPVFCPKGCVIKGDQSRPMMKTVGEMVIHLERDHHLRTATVQEWIQELYREGEIPPRDDLDGGRKDGRVVADTTVKKSPTPKGELVKES
jgi:hypothetical protein